MLNVDEDEFVSNKPKKDLCENCITNEFKYKCPRCNFKSCSIICVKEHKRIKNCTGIKDKFSKHHLKDFNDNDYYRDINFLNKAINDTNNSNKKVFNLEEKSEEDILKEKKHKNLKKLAKKFKNINLECSPSIMKQFKENQSYCDSKLKKFFWTVKFTFLNFNKISHIFAEPFDDAVETLSTIFDNLVMNKEKLNFDLLQIVNGLDKNKIRFLYKDALGESKQDVMNIDGANYVILDKDILLKDVLNGRTIFEYPEFYIL
jgi:hypothetical protein